MMIIVTIKPRRNNEWRRVEGRVGEGVTKLLTNHFVTGGRVFRFYALFKCNKGGEIVRGLRKITVD